MGRSLSWARGLKRVVAIENERGRPAVGTSKRSRASREPALIERILAHRKELASEGEAPRAPFASRAPPPQSLLF